MVPCSRRALLRATAGLGVGAAAGCQGFGGSSSSDEREPKPPGTPITDYEHRVVHADGERSLFRPTGSDQPDRRAWLTRQADRDAVQFHEGATELAAFVDETAFDSQSVALFQRQFPECRRLGVRSVRRRPTELRVELCIPRRPADVDCRTDRRRSGVVALRLPVTDVSASELAASVGSQCRPQTGPYRTKTGDRQ